MARISGQGLVKKRNPAVARRKRTRQRARVSCMKRTEIAPVTEGRLAVRGLAASKRRSMRRLKVMAQVRAMTMQARTSARRAMAGPERMEICSVRKAQKVAMRAKGSAKTECANLMRSRKVATGLCAEAGAEGGSGSDGDWLMGNSVPGAGRDSPRGCGAAGRIRGRRIRRRTGARRGRRWRRRVQRCGQWREGARRGGRGRARCR